MGRKGMKGFMKSASRSSGKPDADETEQPSTSATEQPTSPGTEPVTTATQPKAAASGPSSAAETASTGSDANGELKQETKGQMLQRHKREMLAHKKVVQRMGKKSKDELAAMDAEIEARHAKELQQLEAAAANSSNDATPAAAAQVAAAVDGSVAEADKASKYLKDLSLGDGDEAAIGEAKPNKAMTKAQKRRAKQAAKDAEREARIAAEQEALGPSERQQEEKELRALLQPLGLAIKEIRADGHCLYRSVEDQLAAAAAAAQGDGEDEQQQQQQLELPDYQQLRELAANYIRQHKDDFAPFLLPEDESQDFDEHFEQYCDALESTAVWGGHLELQALSHALKRQIKVHAVGMSSQSLGDEYAGDDKPPALELCYLRHAFGLGEHYNSTKKQRSVRFSTEHDYYEHEGPVPGDSESDSDEAA